jgi:ABC-2 type transport system permease protein
MRVLVGKEILELRRTFRFIVLPALFLVFGILGPAVIRALPLILKNSGGQQFDLQMPEFGPADGLAQFLQLTRQMGLLAVIVVYMGIVAGERKDGTLAMLFVKPVSRMDYLWSRWAVNGAYVLVSFLLGSAVAVLYTLLLLGRPDYGAMAEATGLYLTYVLLVFSWTTLFSALMRSPAAAAGLSVVPLFLLGLLGYIWKPLGLYGPYGATAAGTAVVGATGSPSVPVPASALISAGLNLALCVLCVLGAYRALRRAEL